MAKGKRNKYYPDASKKKDHPKKVKESKVFIPEFDYLKVSLPAAVMEANSKRLWFFDINGVATPFKFINGDQ